MYDLVCHKSNDLMDSLHSDNWLLHLIPPHYTSLLQPCDVGINKPLKDRLKKSPPDWRSERHDALLLDRKMPSPKRKEILEWLKNIWKRFSVEIVRNSFTGYGYFFEEGINCETELETESDSD